MALARSVSVKLRADVAEYVAGLGKAAGATKEFKTELNEAAKKGNLDAVVSGATAAGLALSGAFGLMVKSAADFDKQMSEVGAVANANAGQLDLLRDAALRAGKDTSFSATEAAKAESELAKAGLSSAEILGGALSGSLSLAAAGGLDLAESADIAAKAMNVFKLGGADVGHIADVLAASANKSATDVHEMGEALKQGGLVAADTGLTLEDTVGTLSAFADRALVGSDAGTSLKTMLQALANPSKESAAKMRELGINAYDAQGNFVGITALAGQLQTKLGGLTQAQRDEATAQIFGSDAKRAALVLYGLGEQGLRDYITAVDDEGAAADMAREKTNNLAGDVERLTGTLETLAIQGGSGASDGLRKLVQTADSLVSNFAAAPPFISETVTVVAGLSGAGLLAFAAFAKVRDKTSEMLTELGKTGPVGERAAKGLGSAAKWGGRVAAALTAVQVASALMSDSVNPQVDALASSLAKYGKTGEKAGEATRVLGDGFSHLAFDLGTLDSGFWTDLGNGVSGFIEGVTGLGGVMDESLQHAKERLGAIDSALAQLVSGGRADEASAAFSRLATEAAKHGISIDELKRGLPQYAAALDGARTSTDLHAQAEKTVAEHADTMAGSLAEAVKKAGSLKDAFDQLNGTMMGWAEAEIAAEAAVDKLAESLAKNGLTWDVNTEKGRANKEELLTGIQAARDAAQAKLDETHSIEQANGVYELYKGKLVQTMIQSGMTKDAAWALVNQFGQMPPLVATQVTAPGLDSARERASGFRSIMEALDGKVVKTQVINEIITRRIDQGNIVPGSGGHRILRFGGVHYAAQGLVNLDGMAGYFPAGDTPTYGFAERGTKGEAFIARNAPDGPSLHYADVAAQWHGGRVMTNAQIANLLRGPRWHGGQVMAATGGASLDADRLADAIASRIVPALAGLADRPAIFEIDSQRIAQAVRQGDRGLARRG